MNGLLRLRQQVSEMVNSLIQTPGFAKVRPSVRRVRIRAKRDILLNELVAPGNQFIHLLLVAFADGGITELPAPILSGLKPAAIHVSIIARSHHSLLIKPGPPIAGQ
jgi:hypothetical protein